MTKKISFLSVFLVLIFCLARPSWAFKTVVLMSSDIKPYEEALQGFRNSCDCNAITISANGRDSSSVLDEIRGQHPDLVLAIGVDALSMVENIRDLPVVYVMVTGPSSYVQGRDNISGVSMYVSPSSYLDAMTKLFPWAKRVGVIYDRGNSRAYVKEAARVAAARGIELITKEASAADAVPRLMDSMKGRIDIFWMLPEAALLNSATVDYMLLFSFGNKVPIFTFSERYIDMGAAAALTISPFHMGVQAGLIAMRLKTAGGPGRVLVDADASGVLINRKVIEKMGVPYNKKTEGWATDAD